jgi:hypothetical protein
MTLMKFKDPKEQEATVGPLFATAAKADAPVFGPVDFTSTEATQKITAAIKKAIHSKDDPVVDLLIPADPALSQSLDGLELNSKSSNETFSKLGIQPPKANNDRSKGLESRGAADGKKFYTIRELHDKSHYSAHGVTPVTNSKSELIDSVMLRRALDGYLFDCKKNWKLVAGDQWLQEVWEWVSGRFLEQYISNI